MNLNVEIVKKLITKHIEITEQTDRLLFAGIQIDVLDQLDLFDIALDIVGFPKDNTKSLEFEQLNEMYANGQAFSRDKWDHLIYDLKTESIDAFVEQLYQECNELVLEQPHLFVKE